MSKKSEKNICIKLQNPVLKKVFNELIESLNSEIKDVDFMLFESLDLKSDLPHYFISDKESINQLINIDTSQKIKKIFLISRSGFNTKTNIEIVNNDIPIKLLHFVDYITSDLRQNLNKQSKIISLNSMSYDESSRRIFNDKISLILTEKENEIFYFLLESKSSISKKVLLKNIWKYNEDIDTHTLETHIYSLRKKLEKKLEIKNILEHKESGYILNKDLL
tara:strand:+ start:618 stop:1280 length:663 start_codon:yes stop_codon:yes gene_type:complete